MILEISFFVWCSRRLRWLLLPVFWTLLYSWHILTLWCLYVCHIYCIQNTSCETGESCHVVHTQVFADLTNRHEGWEKQMLKGLQNKYASEQFNGLIQAGLASCEVDTKRFMWADEDFTFTSARQAADRKRFTGRKKVSTRAPIFTMATLHTEMIRTLGSGGKKNRGLHAISLRHLTLSTNQWVVRLPGPMKCFLKELATYLHYEQYRTLGLRVSWASQLFVVQYD